MTEPSDRGDRYADFPEGFFRRTDESSDRRFYHQARMVNHIDAGAIAAVGRLYGELGIEGNVLDLMSSWVSHFLTPPARLVTLGMNAAELTRNEAAVGGVVVDLNRRPSCLPFPDAAFDHAVCAVSVDYLRQPLEVFDDVARVLRPGGLFCNVFSNRLFPSKAISGWLHASEDQRVFICQEYFRRSGEAHGGWSELMGGLVTEPGAKCDPLYAVWARRA